MDRINNWTCGEHTVLLVKSDCIEQRKQEYISRVGIKLYIDESGCSLIDNGIVKLSDNNIELFDNYCTGDILKISDTGLITVLFTEKDSEIDIFMTNKCNSNCIMCPLSEIVRKRDDKNEDFLDEYINLLPQEVGYINVTGGEPTLYSSRFVKTMDRLKRKFQNSDFQLLTNGRSFADKKFLIDVIEVCPSGIRFAIPIHSSNESVHDGITRSKGSLVQTTRGIRNLLSLQQKVEIRIVISKKNIHTMYDTALYIIEKFPQVFCVNFIGMEMMGNAAINREELWIDYEEAFNYSKKAIDILIKNGIDVQLYNFPLCCVEKGYWHIAVKSITDYKVRYMDECNECKLKEICGGFFYSTKQVINPIVKPFK